MPALGQSRSSPGAGSGALYAELSNEQRRQFIDTRQVFEAYQEAAASWKHSYDGNMRWAKRGGRSYLLRKVGKTEKSLGRQSAETRAMQKAFVEGQTQVRERLAGMSARLDELAPVNKAMGLGRVPQITARIIRRLDQSDLLGRHLLVVGTNALFAYEARAGIQFAAGLVATGDADLLWDARNSLCMLLPEVRREGILGVLKRVDTSFATRQSGDFRAVNRDGFYVDLIRPEDESIFSSRTSDRLGDRDDDLQGSPIHGLHWLINAPRFEQIAIGEDGYPLRLISPDPRAFALHKLWISRLADRDPVKRLRDEQQAMSVSLIARKHLNLDFAADDLQSLPAELRRLTTKLVQPKSKSKKPAASKPPEPNW